MVSYLMQFGSDSSLVLFFFSCVVTHDYSRCHRIQTMEVPPDAWCRREFSSDSWSSVSFVPLANRDRLIFKLLLIYTSGAFSVHLICFSLAEPLGFFQFQYCDWQTVGDMCRISRTCWHQMLSRSCLFFFTWDTFRLLNNLVLTKRFSM